LKPSIQKSEALKSSMTNLVAMCDAFSLNTVPLPQTMRSTKSPVLEIVTASDFSFDQRAWNIVHINFFVLNNSAQI
jgi:hypothetical protein